MNLLLLILPYSTENSTFYLYIFRGILHTVSDHCLAVIWKHYEIPKTVPEPTDMLVEVDNLYRQYYAQSLG